LKKAIQRNRKSAIELCFCFELERRICVVCFAQSDKIKKSGAHEREVPCLVLGIIAMALIRSAKGPALLPTHVLEDLEERYINAMRRWQAAVASNSPQAGCCRAEMNRLEAEVRRMRYGY